MVGGEAVSKGGLRALIGDTWALALTRARRGGVSEYAWYNFVQ